MIQLTDITYYKFEKLHYVLQLLLKTTVINMSWQLNNGKMSKSYNSQQKLQEEHVYCDTVLEDIVRVTYKY